MSARARDVDNIRDRIECPQCRYSLRGLGDGIVDCPECGFQCDIAKLITLQWERPWHEAPSLTRLTLTVLFSLLALPGLGVLTWFVLDAFSRRVFNGALLVTGIVLLLPTALGWVALVHTHKSDLPPLKLSMVLHAHFVVLGYLLAMFGLPALLLIGMSLGGAVGLPMTLLAMVGILASFYYARRSERELAETCIRRYLDHQRAQ